MRKEVFIMKSKTKNALISVLGASFIAMSMPSAVYAEADGSNAINVNIRIEGISERIYCGDVIFPSDSETASAADIIKFADDSSDEFEITWTESDYGAYISAVNGEAAATFDAWDGWMFRVNGIAPSVGVSAYEISDGDEIVLYYSYMDETTSMQYPEMSYDLSTGIVSFTSMDTVGYDDNWNPIISEQPVSGMSVTFTGSGAAYEAETDENGKIDLSGAVLAKGDDLPIGDYAVSYYKKNESGAPLVLRSAPDAVLEYGYMLGDVNGDGVINAVDASCILTAYAQTSTGGDPGLDEAQAFAANVNKDTAINAVDASKVLSYYAYTATGGEGSFGEFLSL